MRALLTLGWLVLLLVYFQFWDLAGVVPGVPLWSLGFLAAFVATIAATGGRAAPGATAERRRVMGWMVLLAAATLARALIPTVAIKDAIVHTVVFVNVVDVVVPLWMLTRALIVVWTGWARVAVLAGLPALLAVGGWLFVIRQPGTSFAGPLPAQTPAEDSLAAELRTHVTRLAGTFGERHYRRRAALDGAAAYIDSVLAAAGCGVRSLPFTADSQEFRNIEAAVPAATRRDVVLVIGAHYDSAEGAPGADDNASGTAVGLALATRLCHSPQPRAIRFVFFANEEPPFFASERMGSYAYAREVATEEVGTVEMVSLETMGYFTDEAGSQRYPFPFNLFYPDRGNFLGFVGNLQSRPLLHRAIRAFRRHARLPSEGAAAPSWIPGVGWSDHLSFWKRGFRAIMITDTAPFRNPHYHLRTDTPDRLDYARMARLTAALVPTVSELAGAD